MDILTIILEIMRKTEKGEGGDINDYPLCTGLGVIGGQQGSKCIFLCARENPER